MPDCKSAARLFREHYGEDPLTLIRCPSRLNLMGDHTDYANLPVLTIAFEPSMYVAAGAAPGTGVTVHFAGQKEPVTVVAGASSRGWSRTIATVLDELGDTARGKGARLAIDGDLPAARDLTESPALTVAIVAALSDAWNLYLDRDQVAAIATRAERRLSFEPTGAEQLAVTRAEAGAALRIGFDPVTTESIPLPGNVAFILASSGDQPPRGDAARDVQDERIIGTRLAAVLLADMIGIEGEDIMHLADVAETDVVDILAEELPTRTTIQDVARTTGRLVQRLASLSHASFDPKRPVPVKGLALHALEEAQRVDAAVVALQAGDLQALGNLFRDSHASLRDQVKCSTPALNTLCKAMTKAGAAGARMTTTTSGSFALAVCSPDHADSVIAAAIEATGSPAFVVSPAACWSRCS